MKEILLLKYGEIVLKGANKRYFEDMLLRQLRRKAKPYGDFEIYRSQSTIYIEPKSDFCDMDGMMAAAGKVFGIVAICRAAVCEKNMDYIVCFLFNGNIKWAATVFQTVIGGFGQTIIVDKCPTGGGRPAIVPHPVDYAVDKALVSTGILHGDPYPFVLNVFEFEESVRSIPK